MVLRARLEVFGWVYAWLVVGSCININRTRAAAAREGCREMDAARKNRRPGGWVRGGVCRGRDGTWWWCGAGAAVRWCCDGLGEAGWLLGRERARRQAPQAVLGRALLAP